MSGSSPVLWILGAVLLVAGFAAGFVVGGGAPGGEAFSEAPLTTGRSGGRDVSSEPMASYPSSSEGAPRLESTVARELQPLRRVLEELPPPEVPMGQGAITGRVVTTTGEPLAGVTVQATPRRPKSMARTKDDREKDLPSRVRDFVDRERWSDLATRKATTGADGRFAVDGLTDAEHYLRATLQGWHVQPKNRRGAGAAKPGAEIEYVATPRVEVSIQVYLPDGSQPETASLSFALASSTTMKHWRATDPVVSLQPGVYQVTATAGPSREYTSKPQTVTLEAGGSASLRLDLEGHPMLKGRVLLAEGESLPMGRVRIARVPKGTAPGPGLLAGSVASASVYGGFRGAPDGVPTFEFTDLRAGTWVVGLARSHRGPILVWKAVEIGNALTEVELELPPLERSEYVVLRVLGPDGKVLPEVRIGTGFRNEGSRSSGGSYVLDREDGSKWVLHHEAGGTETTDGTFWIEAQHPLYGSRRVEYAAGTAPDLEIRFAKPASLELTVSGVVGSRYDGRVRVRLAAANSDGRSSLGRNRDKALDEDGRATFDGVQPGSCEVVVLLGSNRPLGGSEVAKHPVTLQTGANRTSVALPALYEVTFQGFTGHAWMVKEGGGGHRSFSSSADGPTVLDGIPAGTYTVHASAKQATFTVPGTRTVTLE